MNKLIVKKGIYFLLVNWLKEPVLQELTENYISESSQVSSSALLQISLFLQFECLPRYKGVPHKYPIQGCPPQLEAHGVC